MAEKGLTVDIEGQEKALEKLNKLTKKVTNLVPLHKLWSASVFKWVIQNFEKEGKLAQKGRKWKKLSPITIAARRKGKSPNRGIQILQDTGTLRKSFAFNAPVRVTLADRLKSQVGTATKYAKKHQFGIKAKRLPKRPMLPEKYSLIDRRIEKITLDFLGDL